MKTFKQYLIESKKTFGFRIKVADHDLDTEIFAKIERGLSAYRMSSITKPHRAPITRQREFAKLGPVGCEMFDLVTDYPAIPPQIQQEIHIATGIPLTHIYVTTSNHDDASIAEEPISDENDSPILLDPEMSTTVGGGDLVGLKKVDSLLKELSRDKNSGTQYKGVNDQILAKSSPDAGKSETTADLPQGKTSPVGSRQNKIPSPVKGRR
jgi:hypothetical protein